MTAEPTPDAPPDVREQARLHFEGASETEAFRHREAELADHLRKMRTGRGIRRLPAELRQQWEEAFEWLSKYISGFKDWPFELQKRHIWAPAGRPGFRPYIAAAEPLLRWWESTGRPVTATKFGSSRAAQSSRADSAVYAPSAAVRFLAGELKILDPHIDEDPSKEGEVRSIQIAYAAAQAWRARAK